MNYTHSKPCLFLAFANNPAEPERYLRNLGEEAKKLLHVLTEAQTSGLCEVIVRENASLDDIFAVFQDANYRDRIVLFHYAGHANSYQLLLENAGQVETAHAEGIAELLGAQSHLRLVFLNGCATEQQAQALLENQVPVVIATSQLIDDAVATQFATRFYTGLAQGANVQAAFTEAKADVMARFSEQARFGPVGKDNNGDGSPGTPKPDLPWHLYVKPGAEQVPQWNLPAAANAPLFGLPPLPETDLPKTPYPHLNAYSIQLAELFFGRDVQIRQLYDRVTDKNSAPLLLIHGANGVGKSSFLAAGLAPRLMANHHVINVSSDYDKGLIAGLQTALDLNDTSENFGKVWRQLERLYQKPVVVIFDQLEQVFIQPNSQSAEELSKFTQTLVDIFGNPDQRPLGKLILCIRERWLQDLTEALSPLKINWGDYCLEPLGRQGIIDVIEGPVKQVRIAEHYNIKITPDFVEAVTNDLLADNKSPIAPILQVILFTTYGFGNDNIPDTDIPIAPVIGGTGLFNDQSYQQIRTERSSNRIFDERVYRFLKKRGYILNCFQDANPSKTAGVFSDPIAKGLTLDILSMFATVHGSRKLSLDELRQHYAHVPDAFDHIIQEFQNIYLLVDVSRHSNDNQPLWISPTESVTDGSPVLRLVHDMLAPWFREAYDEVYVDLPGPRARRILEGRAEEWQHGQTGTFLNESELKLVEQGHQGMRDWRPDERRLIDASRKHIQQKRIKRLQKFAGVTVLVLVAAVALIFSYYQFIEVENVKQTKELEDRAKNLITEANKQMSQDTYNPALAALLTIESLKLTPTPDSYQLWQKLMSELPTLMETIKFNEKIEYYQLSDDKQVLLAIADDDSVTPPRLMALPKGARSRPVPKIPYIFRPIIYLWNIDENRLIKRIVLNNSIRSISFDSKTGQVALRDWSDQDLILILNYFTGALVNTIKLLHPATNRKNENSAIVIPEDDSNFFDYRNGQLGFNNVLGVFDNEVRHLDIKEKPITQQNSPGNIYQIELNTDHSIIVTAGYDKTVRLWNSNDFKMIWDKTFKNIVDLNFFQVEGNKIAYKKDKRTIEIFLLNSKEDTLPDSTIVADSEIMGFSLDTNGETLAIVKIDSSVELWDLRNNNQKKIISPVSNKACSSYPISNPCTPSPWKIRFSSTNDKLLVEKPNRDGKVRIHILDFKTGSLLFTGNSLLSYPPNDHGLSLDFLINIPSPKLSSEILRRQDDKYVKLFTLPKISGSKSASTHVSPDDEFIFSIFHNSLYVFRIDDGQLFKKIAFEGEASKMFWQVSNNSKWIASSNQTFQDDKFGGGVEVINIESESHFHILGSSIGFLPNDKLIVFDKGKAVILDITTKKKLASLSHESTFRHLFPGKNHVVAVNENEAQIFNIENSSWNRDIFLNGKGYFEAVISDSGNYLATWYPSELTNTSNDFLKISNRFGSFPENVLEKPTPKSLFLRHTEFDMKKSLSLPNNISNVSFSPEEKEVWIATKNHKTEIWNIESEQIIHTLNNSGNPLHIQFDKNSKCVAIETDKGVEVWRRLPSPKRMLFWPGGKNPMIKNDCKELTTNDSHGIQRLKIEASSGELLRIVGDIKISPGGKYLAHIPHIYNDSTLPVITVWDLDSMTQLMSIPSPVGVRNISFSKNEKQLLIMTHNEIQFIDIDSKIVRDKIKLARRYERGFFINENRYLDLVHLDGKSALFSANPMTGDHDTIKYDLLPYALDNIYYTKNFRYFPYIKIDSEKQLNVWDMEARKNVFTKNLTDDKIITAFNSANTEMALNTSSGLYTISLTQDHLKQKLLDDKSINDVPGIAIFSKDGNILFAVRGSNIIIYDNVNDVVIDKLVVGGKISHMAHNEKGDILAAATEKRIYLWDWQNMQHYATFNIDDHPIGLHFIGNNNLLVGEAAKELIHTVWSLDTNKMVFSMCNRFKRNFTEKEWYLYFGDIPYRKSCELNDG